MSLKQTKNKSFELFEKKIFFDNISQYLIKILMMVDFFIYLLLKCFFPSFLKKKFSHFIIINSFFFFLSVFKIHPSLIIKVDSFFLLLYKKQLRIFFHLESFRFKNTPLKEKSWFQLKFTSWNFKIKIFSKKV